MNRIERLMINSIAGNNNMPLLFRLKIYQLMKLDFGNSEIISNCYFSSKNVSIGRDSFVNRFCQFHASDEVGHGISIGEKCYIAMNVNFCCISHEIGEEEQRAGKKISGKIHICDGVWIGASSVIGNPARKIKALTEGSSV
jgi:maltose O-acetyltransferase